MTPPTWRHDVTTEACIVEELARLYGYDRIPAVPLPRASAVNPGLLTQEQRRRGAVRRAVAGQGLAEAVTWSFVPPEQARLFGDGRAGADAEPAQRRAVGDAALAAAEPGRPRPSATTTASRSRAACSSSAPASPAASRASRRWRSPASATARPHPGTWAERDRPADALDAKADALAALAAAGVRPEQVQTSPEGAPSWYHPGRSGRIVQGNLRLATFGELHPDVLAAYDLAVPAVAFELDLDALPKPKARPTKARPALEPLPFPPVDRDFAFLVDATVPAARLLDAVRAADRKLVREVRLFDVYEGKGVPEGKRSLAVAVRLQAPDRTLTEAEIEQVAARIVAAAEKATGAVLRAVGRLVAAG